MQKYKVDWLTFSVGLEGRSVDFELLEMLGYSVEDFEEVPGKFFYNSGATLANMVNVYWNDPNRPLHRNSSKTMTVVFTGQGSTDLAEKWKSDWSKLFCSLRDYGEVKITRIDLALDDFDETVKFVDIIEKLEKGHYRSSKKSYNVVKTSNARGETLGETIYLGKARARTGSQGNVYARFYDKRAQYIEKNELFPTEVVEHWKKTGKESWQRYEISYSKKYAGKIVDQIVSGVPIDKVFKTSLRDLLELYTPRKDKWYKAKFWEDFLKYDEALTFGNPERDVMLGDVLEWLKVAVAPTLGILEEVGRDKGFDIYELLREVPKPEERSKKQVRLLNSSLDLPKEVIEKYMKNFVDDKKIF